MESVDVKEKTEELTCEWRKFKYNLLQLKGEIPEDVLRPPKSKELTTLTTTEWLLQHMVSNIPTYSHFFPELIRLAELCMSLQSAMPGLREVHQR